MSIVKSMYNIGGSCKGPFERLEPDVGKLASPVLRGLGGSNAAWLPGPLRARNVSVLDHRLIAT
jgi:hypothetical protein